VLDRRGREVPADEILDDQRKIAAHLFFVFVLLIVPVVQVVDGKKIIKNIRTNIERGRRLQAFEQARAGFFLQDACRQQHAGCFAANSAAPELMLTDFRQV